jgi:predicted nucleic acid-binding protein
LGIVLDSSVIIAAERAHRSAAECLKQILAQVGNRPAVLSAIGYAELAHGVYQAKTDIQRTSRMNFLAELVSQLSVYPFTREAADIAAKIGAEGMMAGKTIPYADLLIGATALSLGFAVFTANDRHFRLIPNLSLISLIE